MLVIFFTHGTSFPRWFCWKPAKKNKSPEAMDTRESGHHSGVSGREGAAASYTKGLFQFAHGFFQGWSLKVVQGGDRLHRL